MSIRARQMAAFQRVLAQPAASIPRAQFGAAPVREGGPSVMIATINPPIGDTGVQTHTRTLHDGMVAAGISCEVVTPFPCRGIWLPIFAARKMIRPINRSWSTRWYRHWHAAALRDALLRRAEREFTNATLLAQCPVSADVALDVRARLCLGFPIAMACHFNFSEAREYRDQGELPGKGSYQAILDFEQRVLGAVDRVIYVSSWAKRMAEEERGIQVRNSSVIWNGIDAGTSTAVTRSTIGLATNDLVLMNVGTLEKRKNQLGLIDLFAAIVLRSPRVRLVLVGDGPERGAIRRRIDALGLGSRVQMLGMRRDVPALLAAADMYVHYAAVENCPVVLLEAARESLPIAAVPGGGVPELLEKLGGVALDAGDNERSVALLQPMLLDASARRRAGHRAREAFERSFTREAMVAAYEKALGGEGAKNSSFAPARTRPEDANMMFRANAEFSPVPERRPEEDGMSVSSLKRAGAADRYLLLLSLVLMGYAMDGKGFAYAGIPPLFVGEVTMAVGLVVLVRIRGWGKLWESPPMLMLSAFILLGIARTIPFVGVYGIDAVRDSCTYYYGAFAFIVAGLLIAEPIRLVKLLDYYRRFARVFLVVILLVFGLYHFAAGVLPSWPWGEGVCLINEKEGDVLVHLGGIVAFWMSGLAGPVPSRWAVFLALDAGVMGAIDRAGMMSFATAMGLGMAHNPRGPIGWRMIGAVLAGVVLLAVSGFRVEIPNGKGREFSFEQIVVNVRSTFGDVGTDGMDSTKEWRTNWWKDIIADTVHGRHFWSGQGFGINLADEYGYQVGDQTLRSPHNIHMTILARMGMPGIVAWALVLGAWAALVGDAYYKARRAGDATWCGLFLFLGAFWLAFLINASFDVFLEGPMGGIWFWSVYGAGVAALWIFKHHPRILDQLAAAKR